ncbi:site-specific integrase [Actinomadura terrae]|uniref:site-specific integrase n=1 Tax=Actinomadura terrae TaxID=604353 RepID=UPI001FA74451|nr:tyrosine-type recombinase/integrase [Actinomadura terrae]
MSERINGFKASIYPERHPETKKFLHYVGVLDLGHHPNGKRNRPKRKAATKEAVREKLTKLADEIKSGIKVEEADTVIKVATDFVDLLERQGRAPSTIRNHRKNLRNHLVKIGHIKLGDLTVQHVEDWLAEVAESLATGTLRQAHNLLSRAIDHAMRRDKVTRNVSRMATQIKGKPTGRESKSLSPAQVQAIFAIALIHRFAPYVVLAITSGLRVDELNALTWNDLDLEEGAVGTVSVVRADRHSGDTKTAESKRALQLADIAVTTLLAHQKRQRKEFATRGMVVSRETRVFTQEDGSPYRTKAARRDFRHVLRKAKISNPEDWTTRETRTTFVSIMSDAGVRAEDIADMCGHDVKTLFRYYRKQLKPRLRQSANVINSVFGAAA